MIRNFLGLLSVLIGMVIVQSSYAESIEANKFTKPSQEVRYRALIDEIRCPVCQGQSIGGSNAGLAKDLREQVRKMIIKDLDDDKIRAFMTDRYGDFVVFKPPIKGSTYILWFAPFAFLALGLMFFLRSLLRKNEVVTDDTIDTTKARELLK